MHKVQTIEEDPERRVIEADPEKKTGEVPTHLISQLEVGKLCVARAAAVGVAELREPLVVGAHCNNSVANSR